MLVGVYTKPNCPACSQTKRLMKKLNIEFTEAPITDEVLTFAKKRGLLQAPIVVIYHRVEETPNITAWDGFREEKIKQLAKEN